MLNKPIDNYEDYLIYSDGKVFSSQSSKFLKPINSGGGYYQVGLCNEGKTNKKIHRLVALAFIPNPENKPYVNHIDGNKLNNDVSNLEWCTQKENIQHSAKQGRNTTTRNKGSKNPKSKLTEPMITIIKKLLAEGELTQKQIGSIFNVGQTIISEIKNNKYWNHV